MALDQPANFTFLICSTVILLSLAWPARCSLGAAINPLDPHLNFIKQVGRVKGIRTLHDERRILYTVETLCVASV